jgi:hypothetical protein
MPYDFDKVNFSLPDELPHLPPTIGQAAYDAINRISLDSPAGKILSGEWHGDTEGSLCNSAFS